MMMAARVIMRALFGQTVVVEKTRRVETCSVSDPQCFHFFQRWFSSLSQHLVASEGVSHDITLVLKRDKCVINKKSRISRGRKNFGS